MPTIEPELSSNVVSSSDDQSNKEMEQTQPSLLENIQEKVSQTITSLTETIQNVVSTNVPTTETHKDDEQVVQQEKSDAQSLEHSVPVDTVHDETVEDHRESYASLIADTTTSTSSDSGSIIVEQTENQETASKESAPSQTLVRFNIRDHYREEFI